MKLLLDEHLSPRLASRCAQERGIFAGCVAHLGLSGASDPDVWQYACAHDYVMVTTNARDFVPLLDVEVHPGMIVLREGDLSRDEQWDRLAVAVDYVNREADPDNYMINRVIEILDSHHLVVREIPSP